MDTACGTALDTTGKGPPILHRHILSAGRLWDNFPPFFIEGGLCFTPVLLSSLLYIVFHTGISRRAVQAHHPTQEMSLLPLP